MNGEKPLILAIETSNPSMGAPSVALGLAAGDGVSMLASESLAQSVRHSDDLMPAIARLFERAGQGRGDLGRVLVSAGPGGFTALRVAIASAKMFGEALGARLVPVPSALVVADALDPGDAPALVCLASKGQTTFGVRFDADAWTDQPQTLGILDADGLERAQVRTIAGDRHLPEAMRRRASELGIRVVEPTLSAEALLRVGSALPPVDPIELAPIYPREPEAVRKWRELHGNS